MTPDEGPILFGARSAGDPPLYYVNGLSILYSPYDFSFLFQRAVPSEPLSESGAIEQDVVARVVMSPEHAKAMTKVLKANLESYEKENGEIPAIDPGIVQRTEAAAKPARSPARRAKRSPST